VSDATRGPSKRRAAERARLKDEIDAGRTRDKVPGFDLELPPLELMKKAQEHRRLQTAIKQSEARWRGSSRLPIQGVTTGQSTECRTG
jgi:hypothetical protein